jgi:hypothetical protein
MGCRCAHDHRQYTAAGELADPVFRQHGVELDVIGDVPEPLLQRLQSRARATRFHGFVKDVSPFFDQARIAIVPEMIGGGFKHKFLHYFFGRLPVATIETAAAGLDPAIRHETLRAANLRALVETIVAHMDEIDDLNRMQQQCFNLAKSLFRWEDRGEMLHQAILSLMAEQAHDALDLHSRNGHDQSDTAAER